MSVRSGRRGGVVALALLAATIALAAAAWLRRDTLLGAAGLLGRQDPGVVLEREIAEEFGMPNPIVWVIEPRYGTIWRAPVLDRVATLTREVFTLPGVVATDVVGLASPNLRDLKLTDAGLEAVYLMGSVPRDERAIDALRARVEGDVNYSSLVASGGRATLVVANLAGDADLEEAGRAALQLRDRHRDGDVGVWVIGAPVLASAVQGAAGTVLGPLAICAGLGAPLIAGLLGVRAALGATMAALLGCLWAGLALAGLGALVVPWSAWALPPTALLAAALAVAPAAPTTALAVRLAVLGLALGGAALAVLVPAPAGWALGLALAVGAGAAVGAAQGVGAVLGVAGRRGAALHPAPSAKPTTRGAGGSWMRLALVAGLVVAGAGVMRLHLSLGLAGYGERYVPPRAAADLHALRRLFPPPSIFVVRLRGEPGFVSRPDVLQGMDALVAEVRADPAVRGAQSLADIVKLVHRSFNEDDPRLFVIPEDRALISRYLTLAYSPGFRRFVDRALSRSALWIYVEGDRVGDLERVQARLEEHLAKQPIAGVEVDPISGDAATTLLMARLGRRLAVGGLGLLAGLTLAGGLAAGMRGALAVAGAGLGAALVGAGLLGWLGLPLDLLTLPLLLAMIASAATTALLGRGGLDARALRRLALGLAVASLPALLAPVAAAQLVGLLLIAALPGAVLGSSTAAPLGLKP